MKYIGSARPTAPRRRPDPVLSLQALEPRDVPAVIWVDDDRQQKPNADFTSIQAAINAARPGDKIMVAPGTYAEHVTVDKDKLTVESSKPLAAKIVGTPGSDGTFSAVRITARKVEFDGFTVTGGATPAVDIGVLVDAGASAKVERNLITRIQQTVDPFPDNGWGIWVGGLVAGGATAELTDNTITDYRKSGIVVFDPASFVTVSRNTVIGAGPTTLIAQNGIEFQDGANGVITQNVVTGNVYTPAGTEATGILVQSAGRVEVSHNQVVGNELGIAAVGQTNPLKIDHNDAVGNTLDGIYLEGVVGADVSQNKSTANGRSGIYVTGQSSGNEIEHNDFRRNAGPDASDDTRGTGTAGTANYWFDNAMTDPVPSGLQTKYHGGSHRH